MCDTKEREVNLREDIMKEVAFDLSPERRELSLIEHLLCYLVYPTLTSPCSL